MRGCAKGLLPAVGWIPAAFGLLFGLVLPSPVGAWATADSPNDLASFDRRASTFPPQKVTAKGIMFPGAIRRAITVSTTCGVNFREADAILDQIGQWVHRPLDETSTKRVGQAISVFGTILRGNECIEVCTRSEVDSNAVVVVEKLRSLTLSFYRNVWIDPTDRRAAMVSTALLRLGPDYWRAGFDAVVALPLEPPPDQNWPHLYRKSGLHHRFDIEAWKVGYSAAGILRRISDQQTVTDFRIDVAALLTASQLDRTERHDLFRDYEVQLHDYRGLKWKLNEVKEALRATLHRELRKTGRLPDRLSDSRGDLLFPCCTEAHGEIDAALESGDMAESPHCWFTGWPGIRILDYETYGDICLMRAVGYGFDFESPWWLAFDDE